MIHLLAQAAQQSASQPWWLVLVTVLTSTGFLAMIVRMGNAKAKLMEAEAKALSAEQKVEAVIEGVERIPDHTSKLHAKASIKKTAIERGVEPELRQEVKRQTGRVGGA